MKALISPNERFIDGCRIVEVTDTPFEVAGLLFWVDCNSDVKPDFNWYDINTQEIKYPPDDPEEIIEQPT